MRQPVKTRTGDTARVTAKAAAARDGVETARGRPARARDARPAPAEPVRRPRIDFGGLDEHVGYAVRRAQVWIFQDVRRALKEHDITPAQFSIMKVVGANAGLAQARVAEALSIERARLVQMLDQLEGRGLIRRVRSERDRRSHQLELSREGVVLLGRLVELMREHERRVVARIGSKGKSELLRILAPFIG